MKNILKKLFTKEKKGKVYDYSKIWVDGSMEFTSFEFPKMIIKKRKK